MVLGWCVSNGKPEGAGLFNSLTGFQILALWFFEMAPKTCEILFKWRCFSEK